MENYFTNAVNIARDICKRKLNKGDIAVDATMGNGNDTELLAELVGSSGKVYSFDIQKTAIENTKKKLMGKHVFEWVNLIHDGHENIDKYVLDKVNLVIFNLGYLPKGEHSITTKSATTLAALKKALSLICKNGIIILVVYYGHEEGKFEKDQLKKYTEKLNQKEYNVVNLCFTNQVNDPPMLIAIEKR